MSAAELIEQAKMLSPEERAHLIESLMLLDDIEAAPECQGPTVPWPDTLERARRIFGDKVLPNIVLEERESRPY